MVGATGSLIYGTDNRLEYGEIEGTELSRWADSTVAQVPSSWISCSSGTCELSTIPWEEDPKTDGENRLCNDVRFRGQPQLANCSAFLVGPDLVVSARHCFDVLSCGSSSFVFGFHADENGNNAPDEVPDSDVYECDSVVASGGVEDWILLGLDRKVRGRYPVNVRHGGTLEEERALTIIGYPYGIPTKISPTGEVIDNAGTVTFQHDVDSFAGNSGSPVFDALTGTIEGIHITPPASHFVADEDENGDCVCERVCPNGGCPGTSGATRITRLSHLIPLTPALTVSVI